MKVGLKVQGGDDLAKRLQELPRAVSLRVQVRALTAAAEPMRAHAERLAPRSDGPGPHMADHIVIAPVSGRKLETISTGHDAAVEVGPAKAFFYARFPEFGTAHSPSQAFMRPAFDAQSGKSLNIAAAFMWEAIRKMDASAFRKDSARVGASRGGSSGGGLL